MEPERDRLAELKSRPLVRSVLRGVATLGVLGAGASIVGYSANKAVFDILTVPWWLLLWLWLWAAVEYFVVRLTAHDAPSSLVAASLSEVELLFAQEKYGQVLRLRETLSRYLWVEGNLRERVLLGEIAEKAALAEEDLPSRLAALVDDLGWTLVALKDFPQAREHIEHGLDLARKAGDFYWTAKALRHLSGIYTIESQYREAKEFMKMARQEAERMPDGRKKTEMLAGIEYGAAVSSLFEGRVKDAEHHAEESEKLRNAAGDQSRIVRIHSLKGKIALTRGDLAEARDLFTRGLREAMRIGRRDEAIRNHLGLSQVFKKQNKLREASEHQEAAHQLLATTPVPYEVEDDRSPLFT